MKTIAILLILSFSIKAQNNKTKLYIGKVRAYANTNSDLTNTTIDTIINQTRTIAINSYDSIIEIGWQLENNDYRLLSMAYKIEKEYTDTIKDEITKVEIITYNYLMFDMHNYPLLMVTPPDKSYCYLYYFWDYKRKAFLRSEKVNLTISNANNILGKGIK